MTAPIAFDGLVYRALNPRWAVEPLSGEGAALYGGRFNRRGHPTLYTALSPVTAMHEAQAAGPFQPITLVAIRARLASVFDGRDAAALKPYGMTPATLADAGWREAMTRGQRVPTQAFAEAIVKNGYHGLLVPSYARNAVADDLNLVILALDVRRAVSLAVIDDEGRLTP